jgi:hypothetical protein
MIVTLVLTLMIVTLVLTLMIVTLALTLMIVTLVLTLMIVTLVLIRPNGTQETAYDAPCTVVSHKPLCSAGSTGLPWTSTRGDGGHGDSGDQGAHATASAAQQWRQLPREDRRRAAL